MEFIDLPPMLQAAGSVRLPGSKSISNRVLLLAALAEGDTLVEALPEVAAGEQIAQATDGGPNPDYNPDADADTPPAAPADKPTRGKK